MIIIYVRTLDNAKKAEMSHNPDICLSNSFNNEQYFNKIFFTSVKLLWFKRMCKICFSHQWNIDNDWEGRRAYILHYKKKKKKKFKRWLMSRYFVEFYIVLCKNS